MARSLALVVVLVFIALLAGFQADAAVTCGQVASDLRPCIPYVTGQVSALPPACCNGVKGLNSAAQTTADRRAACNCIRSQASGISGLQPNRLSGLPGSCGVHLPFPISASTDCSRGMLKDGRWWPDLNKDELRPMVVDRRSLEVAKGADETNPPPLITKRKLAVSRLRGEFGQEEETLGVRSIGSVERVEDGATVFLPVGKRILMED
ncbi:hypothetical protein ZIOFF_048016 [Zingiber officinale]|uniref:Non-specific lipid-transfer protein n=1 Tax=Zingiber officinale TaxID=94328 RepID=A0A8J5FQJ2_ZINOF|nr:hypothetical protein ZIOFF_048016 [Zingiber officinale]